MNAMTAIRPKYDTLFSRRLMANIAIVVALSTIFACGNSLFAQQSEIRAGRNNPYSPSPSTQVLPAVQASNNPALTTPVGNVSFIMQARKTGPQLEPRPAILEAAFSESSKTEPSLTAIYKIGVGDVLLISLNNSAQGTGYYTVQQDGTIDFPLAVDDVNVLGKTPENLANYLKEKIRIFTNPQVEVRVHQYASHRISVTGLVEFAGEKNLQREAMPLFVIKAEAGVSSKAARVLITRNPSQNEETYEIRDPKTDDVLVFSGDKVDFTAASDRDSYVINGQVLLPGQKAFKYGISLHRAIVAAGGTKGDPKRAVVRRKDQTGRIASIEYNLRSIKAGRSQDPILLPGDILEIGN